VEVLVEILFAFVFSSAHGSVDFREERRRHGGEVPDYIGNSRARSNRV
jgi:hypothetical protein